MSQNEAIKVVLFFGEELAIPDNHDYVACDANGDIFSYIHCPEYSRDNNYWRPVMLNDSPYYHKNIGPISTDKAQRMMECYHVSA